jgi:hypothetical protein
MFDMAKKNSTMPADDIKSALTIPSIKKPKPNKGAKYNKEQ